MFISTQLPITALTCHCRMCKEWPYLPVLLHWGHCVGASEEGESEKTLLSQSGRSASADVTHILTVLRDKNLQWPKKTGVRRNQREWCLHRFDRITLSWKMSGFETMCLFETCLDRVRWDSIVSWEVHHLTLFVWGLVNSESWCLWA